MPINPDQIRSDVTLELDEPRILAPEFSKAVDHFFALVKELVKQAAPNKDPSAWTVQLYPGSAGIGYTAVAGMYDVHELDFVKRNLPNGLREIESGKRPRAFSDAAIEHARNLAAVFGDKDSAESVRLWVGKNRKFEFSKKVYKQAEEILEPAYTEDGSVDGTLEKLSAHGTYEFVVYDTLSNRAIKCTVDEPLIEEAKAAFRQRVEVLGRVHYRRDGQPVSVNAKTIVRYPTPDDIPSVEEMRGLLAGG